MKKKESMLKNYIKINNLEKNLLYLAKNIVLLIRTQFLISKIKKNQT